MLFASSLTTADAIAVPSYVAVPRPNGQIVNNNICYISVFQLQMHFQNFAFCIKTRQITKVNENAGEQ